MLLFQKALQVAFTHIAVLFTLGGFVVSSFFSGNGLKVIDSRPATNPWLAGGLLLVEHTVNRIFKPTADHSVVSYPGYASTIAPVDILRANQSLALVWNVLDVADLIPVIPSFAAFVSASVSSSVSSVNAELFSKNEPKKALLDTGRPRCSASGSKSNGLATNGNNTLIDVAAEFSVFAGQISSTQSSLTMGWKAGYVADALVVKGATVPNVPSSTVLVSVSRISSFTTILDAIHFCLSEPNKAFADTGRPHCAALGSKKMSERTTAGTITGTSSSISDQCYADQFLSLYWKAGYGTCPSPIRPVTVSPTSPLVIFPLAFISSSITSMDAMFFCLNEPNKALLNSGRPRCAASCSKKKGQGANENNARKGTTRKSSGSSDRSSDSSGSSSSGSSGRGSSGGSAPPPPPPPPPGRSGGVATRRSSRLRNTPRPDYALTTPRARRALKAKEFEAPPDPPSGPPPPPPPNEPNNHGPYDVGDLYDPFTPWLRKIMIFIFCVYAAYNMAPKLVRIVPRSLVSQILGLRNHFAKLQDLVPIFMERANDWFWLTSRPAPYFASHRIHVPSTWQSSDGVFNPFPVFTDAPSEGLQLYFPSPSEDISEALVQAGLIERARGPLFGLRKYLSRLIIAIIVVFAAVLMLDVDCLCDMVERVMRVDKEEIIHRAGVAGSVEFDTPSTPFWLALNIEYKPGDSILDEPYLATLEASASVEGKLNEDATNTSDTADDLSTFIRDLVEHESVSRVRDEETASDASFHRESAEDLNEEEAQIVCVLVFLAAYLLQQQHAATEESEELTTDDSFRKEEDVIEETIQTEEVEDISLDSILEKNCLEVTVQNSGSALPLTSLTVNIPCEPMFLINEDATLQLEVGNELSLSSFSSQLSVRQERSSNPVATVYDSINDTISAAFEIEKTTPVSSSLQTETIELTKLEDTPEAATGSYSTVTGLLIPIVESERTGDTSAEASNSTNELTSQLDSSVHGTVHESSTSDMATALSEPRGIWSPPVTEINGLPFVVVEGARKRRKRNRKPKALANSA